MSISAKLFYSTNVEKQTLHRKIIPTDKQQEAQRERWKDLVDYLEEDLKEKTGYPIKSWLQGSYKFATQIRPASLYGEFDIDLGIYFIWEGEPSDGNFSPIELKNIVQKSLLEYAKEVKDEVKGVLVPPKNRCCRIVFSDNFHIDVPVYHLDEKLDTRNLATEKNEWENSDPKTLHKWFISKCKDEVEGFQIRRLIRYIKMWAALNFEEGKRPPSILLTVLMIEAFESIPSEVFEDDDLFSHCVEKILERVSENSKVYNPVNLAENINKLSDEDFQIFIKKINYLYNVSIRAQKVITEADAAVIWQEVFKQFFPLPEVLEETSGTSKALTVVEFDPQVRIFAKETQNTNINRTYEGINKIGPIPKGCKISFKIINSSRIPLGATLEWMVRNEGEEAENINDLGHSDGSGIDITDRSAYNGTHYMDVVAKSPYGYPIGFRRIPVTILGIQIPPRNPIYKPGYLRIKRKRK